MRVESTQSCAVKLQWWKMFPKHVCTLHSTSQGITNERCDLISSCFVHVPHRLYRLDNHRPFEDGMWVPLRLFHRHISARRSSMLCKTTLYNAKSGTSAAESQAVFFQVILPWPLSVVAVVVLVAIVMDKPHIPLKKKKTCTPRLR